MARMPAGQMRSWAVILVAVAAVLLVAVAVLVGRSTPSPPGVSEAAAEHIATEIVAQQAPSTQVLDVAVERYEDHGTFWRVTLHADVIYGSVETPAQPIRIYYQIDVDKQSATPSIFAQG